MDKLNFKTKDGVDVNLEKLSQLFPEAITETKDENGNIKRVANLDVLKTLLNGYVADPNDVECYEFTWPGKREAIMEAAKSTTKTLRPCPEESKNWDTTQNLYIEGDNLEVLKLLQESYLGKVKMIYIDPPYNTGKDFVYRDNFNKTQSENQEDQTVRDEETDNNLFQNTESNGRFHSDWCSMIYPRLKLARDLLRDDGVIFISIDDNEVHNLRKICDEIFGADNLLSEIIWHLTSGVTQGHFTRANEFILTYAKNKNTLPYFKDKSGGKICHGALKKISSVNPASEITFKANTIEYEGGTRTFVGTIGGSEKEYIKDKLVFVDGRLAEDCTITAGWAMKNQVISWLNGHETFDSKGQKVLKFYFNSQGILFYEKERETLHPKTVLPMEVGNTKVGSDEILDIFGKKVLDFPKPVNLIKFLSNLITQSNDLSIILDFFSGSATTAHACMQLNAEDGGNRKFIMVQLPEVCAPESEASKAGYKNICEIGKERIRRAGEKIKAEHATTAPNLDIGFRVLKLDESNMKEVYYKPDELSQDMLSGLESNIKEDRNDLDLLYACLIDWGVELALPLKTEEINGVKVYTVNDSEIPDLIACFSENIPETTIREIAKRKPLRVVFRDSSFADSPSKINVTEIFKTLSPNTTIKVL